MADKKRVAVVHGWGGSYDATFRSAGWEKALTDAGLSPVGIDLPGHADAAASDDPAHYSDLAAALDARLPSDVVLAVGFSLGTKLLLEIEARQPGRFRRIVLGGIGDNIFAPEAGAEAVSRVLRGLTPIAEAPPGIQGLVRYSEKSHSNPKALAAVLERTSNPVHVPERLRQIKARLLLVNATGDRIAMPDKALIAALPVVEVLHLAGGDHIGLPSEAEFLKATVSFLNRNGDHHA